MAHARTRAAFTTPRSGRSAPAACADIFDPLVSSKRSECRASRSPTTAIRLDASEQRRRWLILSLLSDEGLDLAAYRAKFGSQVDADFPEIAELAPRGLAEPHGDILALTHAGARPRPMRSGPWLYSADAPHANGGVRARMKLDILYRGPLASCNYGCEYCPFAKKKDDREALSARDEQHREVEAVRRVARGATAHGSARRPRHAVGRGRWSAAGIATWLGELSHLPQIRRCAVQTNLSAPLDWVARANPDKLALWCTYHPEWTTEAKFLAQCCTLEDHGIRLLGRRRPVNASTQALHARFAPRTSRRDLRVDQRGQGTGLRPRRGRDVARDRSAVRAQHPAPCQPRPRLWRRRARDHRRRRRHDAAMSLHQGRDRQPLRRRIGSAALAAARLHAGRLPLPRSATSTSTTSSSTSVYAAGLLERIPVPEARVAGVRLPVVA